MFPDSYFSDLKDIRTDVKFPVVKAASLRVGFGHKTLSGSCCFTKLSLIHWFSIDFSTLRCEKTLELT